MKYVLILIFLIELGYTFICIKTDNLSGMENKILQNKISEIINGDYIDLDEYNVKYYFSKKLEELLPSLPKEEIYAAIQYANNVLEPPRKKREFIEVLISKLGLEN